jgi:membrane dipeptidase
VVHGKSFSAVRNQSELKEARLRENVASLLSLEGGGCLRGQPELLRMLFRLGVRGMGLTWNHANELADGCREARGAGLTQAGRAVVKEMQRLGVWIDIAHLADAGVKDVFSMTDGPVMASHANSRTVLEHPRNLTDGVIREIVSRQGWMGLVFEGSFVASSKDLSIDQVFQHLDHMLELGAEDCVGFGSDFDGTSHPIPGLTTAADYKPFSEMVLERYGASLGNKILFENFERFLTTILPRS